ncbi:MAG: aldehyde dehydrogenase family protein [Elusimicrobia bacterium]|nr:aldehyde dehydrogenase family protein [Elusimicrobiota bacterium]
MTKERRHRLWLDGAWRESLDVREIRSPYTGRRAALVDEASAEQMARAVAAAAEAFPKTRALSRHVRSRLLQAMARGIEARRAEFVELMVAEAGKPATLADAEVSRAVTTFTGAAEEAKRFGGEVVPLDADPAGRAFEPAVSFWVPRGPVLAITPFNFPLNLVAHKVAPALAVGAPVLVKPAPQAPGPAAVLAQVFAEAAEETADKREAWPLAALQVVSCSNDAAGAAVADRRMATLSFTGSAAVGWMLQGRAVGKKVCLELGGNAAVVVHSDAELERAAARCAAGAFGYAGQVCISVQRIFVQRSVSARFSKLLLAETAKLGVGDPADRSVSVGPLIDAGAADRVMSWIEEAKRKGAKVLAGGARKGNLISPTVLSKVRPESPAACEEVFGPVAVLDEYDDFEEALARVNSSRYGLQAGVFTDSVRLSRQAAMGLEVGAVLLNEIPTYRADPMPYGGVKDSGLGREGVRYAMEEYCERRTVLTWRG